MIKCVLFDRDGTLGDLVEKAYPQSLVPYPHIQEVFARLKENGYTVGVITNQSSIARGTGGGYDFDKEFAAWGANIWAICPHDTHENCNCRKPKSGLIIDVCNHLGISPTECIMIGDRITDVECGKNVGAEAALVLTGNGMEHKEKTLAAYPDLPVFKNFEEILTYLSIH